MFENIRQDLNKRFDKIGEGVLPGRAKSGTYEERLNRARSGGGAGGTQATSLGVGEQKPRNLPPPLPGRSGGAPPAHEATSIPPPPTHTSDPHLPARSAQPPATASGTNLQFSRFSESDKQEFFQLLDDYFANRTQWYVSTDTRRSGCIEYMTHGIGADIYRVPFSRGYLCLKRVDMDEQPAPHDVVREARVLSRCHNAGIVPLLASFVEEPDDFTQLHWLAMPWYDTTLELLVNSAEWNPAPASVLQIMSELAGAVCYLHTSGIAHRDIKPSNVLMCDNHITLCDFGVAWEDGVPERASFDPNDAPPSLRARIPEVGSGAYRAPELLFAPISGYDAYKVDIWALGTTIATMFTSCTIEEKVPETYVWEEELWPSSPEQEFHRQTLFNGTHSDIGLACDIFSVLGLPSSTEEWPEAAEFQPPLDQMPFTHCAPRGSILDRLTLLDSVRSRGEEGIKVTELVATLLPRMIVLSASQRIDIASIVSALDS